MLEVLKFLIQPVAIERDANGKIIREVPGDVISIFDPAKAEEAMRGFEMQIRNLNSQQPQQQPQGGDANGIGGSNSNQDNLRQPQMSGPPQLG